MQTFRDQTLGLGTTQNNHKFKHFINSCINNTYLETHWKTTKNTNNTKNIARKNDGNVKLT